MKHTLLFIIATLLFIGCGDDSPTAITPLGSLKGHVDLYDTLSDIFVGVRKIPKAPNVIIELKGRATTYTTKTDESGNWEIRDIPTGVYDFTAKLDGFSTYHYPQLNFIADGVSYLAGFNLCRRSNVSTELILRGFEEYYYVAMRSVRAVDTNGDPHTQYEYDSTYYPNGKALFTAQIMDDPRGTPYYYSSMLFFSPSATIDPEQPESYQATIGLNNPNELTGKADFLVTVPWLNYNGFQSGQKVYCVAYSGDRDLSATISWDPVTNKSIYTAFSPNHSEVKSFIVP